MVLHALSAVTALTGFWVLSACPSPTNELVSCQFVGDSPHLLPVRPPPHRLPRPSLVRRRPSDVTMERRDRRRRRPPAAPTPLPPPTASHLPRIPSSKRFKPLRRSRPPPHDCRGSRLLDSWPLRQQGHLRASPTAVPPYADVWELIKRPSPPPLRWSTSQSRSAPAKSS
jgi:hypothetical protein